MMKQSSIQIKLTADQQAKIEQATGKQIAVVALKPEALEGRVAPGIRSLN